MKKSFYLAPAIAVALMASVAGAAEVDGSSDSDDEAGAPPPNPGWYD